MIHTIENNYLSVSIQHTGAELCSLKSKKTNQEYMWDANPNVWGSYAPVLFPIIGCLKNGEFTYKGKTYSIPKHGFIRNNSDLKVDDKTSDCIILKYLYNEETLKMYPFKFEFYITFKLEGSKLLVQHKVVNAGEQDMLFSLGGHPGFKCPLNKDEAYEDYYIEFEHEETDYTWMVSDEGLTTGETKTVLKSTNKLPLTQDMFKDDALIFKNLKSRKATLKNNHNSNCLKVLYPDFNYLGIWAKPGEPFVCIEPWLGVTDDEDCTGEFTQKEGLISLPAQQVFKAEFAVEVVEE